MASPTTRRVIWTGAIASVTAVGTVCGAMLKTDRDALQEVEALRETTFDERITLLEARKSRLLNQREEFQRKFNEIETRSSDSTRPTG